MELHPRSASNKDRRAIETVVFGMLKKNALEPDYGAAYALDLECSRGLGATGSA
jgi:hypothetical protein